LAAAGTSGVPARFSPALACHLQRHGDSDPTAHGKATSTEPPCRPLIARLRW